jgi:hypothetical protein
MRYVICEVQTDKMSTPAASTVRLSDRIPAITGCGNAVAAARIDDGVRGHGRRNGTPAAVSRFGVRVDEQTEAVWWQTLAGEEEVDRQRVGQHGRRHVWRSMSATCGGCGLAVAASPLRGRKTGLRRSRKGVVPTKPVPDMIRGGNRFSETTRNE